jgi:phage FluMu protein Com
MRGVRCQRCSHMFSLSVDQVVAALDQLSEKGESHYGVECPRCRHLVKVPRGDLERMRPRPAESSVEVKAAQSPPAPAEAPE